MNNQHLYCLILEGIKAPLTGTDTNMRKKQIRRIIHSAIEQNYELDNFSDVKSFSKSLSNAVINLRDSVAGQLNVDQFKYLLENLLNTTNEDKKSTLLSFATKKKLALSNHIIGNFLNLYDVINIDQTKLTFKDSKPNNPHSKKWSSAVNFIKNISKSTTGFIKKCRSFIVNDAVVSPVKNILKTIGIASLLCYYTPSIIAFKTSHSLVKRTMPKSLTTVFSILNGLASIIGATFPNITYTNELTNYISDVIKNHPIKSILLFNTVTVIEYNLDDLKLLYQKWKEIININENPVDKINTSSKTCIFSQEPIMTLQKAYNHNTTNEDYSPLSSKKTIGSP